VAVVLVKISRWVDLCNIDITGDAARDDQENLGLLIVKRSQGIMPAEVLEVSPNGAEEKWAAGFDCVFVVRDALFDPLSRKDVCARDSDLLSCSCIRT
jgi:hypothetical protein